MLKQVTLDNYCQHVAKTVDIQGNLIAVIGHNGAGKSNFMGAIQFALTGEQPGKTKDALVHWGAKDGRVILDFEFEGKPGRITRPIVSTKVTLEYEGETVSGITAVAKALEERFHVDKDLVRQSVFVRQKEIDTIISAKTDKRDREVAFQKLLGLDAAKIHRNLTDWLYQAVKPVNYDIQLAEGEQRLGELETRVAGLAEEVKAADEAVRKEGPLEGDTAALQKSMAAIGAVLAAQTQVRTAKDKATEAFEALEAVKIGLGDIGTNPGVDIAEKAQENQVLREEIAKADAIAKAAARLNATKASVAACEQALVASEAEDHPTDDAIQILEDAIQTCQESLAAKNADLSAHRKALGALNGGETACPVCGKPLDVDTVAKLQQELSNLKTEVSGLSTLIDGKKGQLSKLKSAKVLWESRHTKAVSDLESARGVLKTDEAALSACASPAVGEATARATIEENNAVIAIQKAYDEKVAGNARAVKEAEVRYDATVNVAGTAQAALEAAVKTATELCGPEAAADWTQAQQALQGAVAEYNAKRDRIQALQLAATKAKATHDEAVTTLETMRKTVANLKEQQKRQDVLSKRLATLEKVRDWFSYQNGPRVLVRQVIDALTDDVNRFLGNFTAPFVVTPNDEDLGFIVEFTDGRDRPEKPQTTEVLSGGELVQLAVAFRFAVYTMFAGKLGLLSLDEPMAFLDADNIGRFGVFLMKVREITKNMNIQVFIATHQQVVIPHMDSVIDLN